MTKDELYALIGHQDVPRDLDIKTLVLDLIREKFTPEEIHAVFWEYLKNLDEGFVKGYLYRRF